MIKYRFKKFSLLREVTEQELKAVSKILNKAKEGKGLSFNSVFGNKTRIMIPFYVKDEMFSYLVTFLTSNGYKPDFKDGIATKKYVDKMGNERERKEKIGKIIDRYKEFYDKMFSLIDKENKLARDKNYDEKEYQEIRNQISKYSEEIQDKYPGGTRSFNRKR